MNIEEANEDHDDAKFYLDFFELEGPLQSIVYLYNVIIFIIYYILQLYTTVILQLY